MARCRFVPPKSVRIQLVDVARHFHALLEADVADGKATVEALADSSGRLEAAEKDGDWIEVKAQLNAGERRAVFTDLVKEANHGQVWKLDPRRIGMTQLLSYLLAWSFVGFDDKPIKITEGNLNLLDADTLAELMRAVEWHEEKTEKDREARKNGKAGESKHEATLLSAG